MKGFVKFINKLGNILILNVLFILTSCLTLGFCLGTSFTALYATFLDLKTDNSGYYVRNYFKHFKSNFKQTIIVDLVLIALCVATYFYFLMINSIEDPSLKLILFAFLALMVIEILVVSSFIFPTIAKFEGNLPHILYLSFMFAHKYIYLSILFIILFFGGLLLMIYVSFAFVFIIFGLIGSIESRILKYIWRGYQYEEVLEI